MRKLVLWGHHIDEYKEMFALTQNDLKGRILEYGCGPSAVNTELQGVSSAAISCDPLFILDKSTLLANASLVFEDMVRRMKTAQDQYDISRYGSFDALVNERRQGMGEFFADYEQGKAEHRYVPVSDNCLPFADFEFDFALSAHYLFADLDDQDANSHVLIIRELARVAKEVRIFPLVDWQGQASPFLGPVLLELQREQYGVEIREVSHALQCKGNAMLRVWAQQCQLS